MEENRTFNMSGLKLAFWGLLFTVVNIRIQGFDIVPDVVGYIMVIIGLGRIEIYEERFSAAKKMAYVLAALSLVNIVQIPANNMQSEPAAGVFQTSADSINFSAGIFGGIAWLATVMMIAGMLATLYFFYQMCMGMKNLLTRVGDDTMARICDDRWKLIMASEIGLLVSTLTVMLGVPFGMILMMAFGILALVALVLFLLLMHRAHKSIDGRDVAD